MKSRRHYTLSGDIYTMGNGVPLLNDYKQEFFWKRFIHTSLGPKLRLGYDAPIYVYLNQVILLLLPWFLSGLFTILVEYAVIDVDIGCYLFGTVICLFALSVQIVCVIVQKKCTSVTPLAINQQNILSEEDEIDFESCCDAETFKFIVPIKRYKINILFHAVISGLLCGTGFWYLLPQTLNYMYSYNAAATVILFILGWITLCIAQYPLTVGASPELATFRAMDNWEIGPLMRPFYVALFFSVDILARYYPSTFVGVNSVLHVLFIFLPLLWLLGILPPLDALIFWLMEQILFVCFGGSQMASDLRLIFMVTMSVFVLVAAYFIPSTLGSVIIIALMGYILSTDVGKLGNQIWHRYCKKKIRNSMKIVPVKGFLWNWTWKEFLFHFIMASGVTCLTCLLNLNSTARGALSETVLGYSILTLTIFDKLLGDMQRVLLVFGLFRNRLFPATINSVGKFKRRKGRLAIFGWLRRVLLDFFAPFIMLSYLCLRVKIVNGMFGNIWLVLGATRAFRWIWQGTRHSLTELSILVIIEFVGISNASWLSLQVNLQLLLISFCRDRFFQLLNKLYTYFVIFVTSWTDKKQRRRSTVPIMIMSIFLYPLVLSVIVIATILSAPLLPLFTLPVFLIGFPRPLRSWPEAVGGSANVCSDTMFYQQLAPEIAKALRNGFANGSLGDPNPGSHYLIRYQDRLTWLLVIERGYNYCTVSIKGLELQETSCHTVEAARVDDIFSESFEYDKGIPTCAINQHLFNTLTPQDADFIETYSDARNVMTGVLDSPDNLHITSLCFIRSLTWVFLRYALLKKGSNNSDFSKLGSVTSSKDRNVSNLSTETPVNVVVMGKSNASVKPKTRLPPISRPGVGVFAIVEKSDDNDFPLKEQESHMSFKSKSPQMKETCLDDFDNMLNESWDSLRYDTLNAAPKFVQSARPTSAASIPGSIWSSDSDSFSIGESSKKAKINLAAGLSNRMMDTTAHADLYLSPIQKKNRTPALDSDDEYEMKDTPFGMPTVDINQRRTPGSHFGGPAYRNGNGIHKLGYDITSNLSFSQASSRYLLSKKWMEIPIEQSKLGSLTNRYLFEWHHHVIRTFSVSAGGTIPDHIISEIQSDISYERMFSQFVMACYGVIYELGSNVSDPAVLGPGHVYKVFCGEIPWSITSDWITDDEVLKKLVLKAYRLAVKLMIDQVLLGEISCDEEYQETLEEYESDWYLGSEKDEEWTQSILNGVPNLMSLGYNSIKALFTSRTLTKQEMMIQIGSLNGELVRAQWANLSLELLYMTNDDEERYSIQAHPTLLRNLTVQAADPPLGYPIFSSEPITVPTL